MLYQAFARARGDMIGYVTIRSTRPNGLEEEQALCRILPAFCIFFQPFPVIENNKYAYPPVGRPGLRGYTSLMRV